MKKLFVLILVSLVATVAVAQQTKEEIQRRQQELQKELVELNQTLAQIKKNKNQSLSQLRLVQRKIATREEMVRSLNKELRLIDDNIYLTNLDIYRYKKELDTLKQNYAKSLVFAYKNRSSYEYLNFLFSATSFNDAIKRLAYLKSYRRYRETQADNIKKTEHLLQQKASELTARKAEKSYTLQEQSKQLNVLEDDKKEHDQVVKELKGKENDLAKQIKNKERDRKKLQQSLAAIIRREIEAARREEARKKEAERLAAEARKKQEAAAAAANANKPAASATPAPSTSNTASANPPKSDRVYSVLESSTESLGQSINFENNRGRLPWPVDQGYISGEFGPQKIAGTKLSTVNDGIIIETPQANHVVRCVANGTVSSILDLGEYQAVIIRHGKYFTVYSHLSSVAVSKGEEVNAGTVVGRTATNIAGVGEVEFQVMNDRSQYLNPEGWLKRR